MPVRTSFKAAFFVALIALTAAVVGACGVAYFGVGGVAGYAERSRAAHEVLASYLSLSNNTARLFKQLTGAVLIDDAGDRDAQDTLQAATRADIRRTRALIAAEVRAFGRTENEEEEFETLAAIERKVDQIIREHDEILAALETEPQDRVRRRIVQLHDRRIDAEFNALISDAIAEEQREVAAADIRLESLSKIVKATAGAIVIIALPLAAIVIIYLNRILLRSLGTLSAAADAYAAGDFMHAIGPMGGREFEALGRRFVAMASEVSAGRHALEATVRQRTAALEQANRKLADNDSARRRFFADISHELRTPLTIMRGEAEVAMRGAEKSPSAYRESLARIVAEATATARLVDDLLFVARVDAGAPRLEMQSVAVGAVLEEAAKGFAAAAAQKGIDIIVTTTDHGAIIRGDRGRLRQVFAILLDNAVRYSRQGGVVAARTSLDVDTVRIEFEDRGVGIPEQDIDRVFERFYRGSNVADRGEGSGLGLPVAKAIIEAHNGHIRLAQSGSAGVVVTVSLPAEPKLRAIV